MRNMKSGAVLFFLVPVILGLVIGRFAYAIDKVIIVRVLLTISDNILVILKFITPILVLCISATAIAQIKGNANDKFAVIVRLFRIIFMTLIPLTIIVLTISLILVPHLTFGVVDSSSAWINPLFKIKIPDALIMHSSVTQSIAKIIDSIYTPFIGVVIGIVLGFVFDYNGKFFYIIKEVQEAIYWFFKKILRPIMPLWIIASFTLTSYSGSGAAFFLTDFLLSILILVLQFSWLSVMYCIVSKKIQKPFKVIYKKGMEIFGYVVSLSGQGSGIVLPFIIQREEELGMDKNKAQLVTATSFNMPGSLISNIVFLVGVINLAGFSISLVLIVKLMFVVMFLTIVAPAIPGGTASIVAGILPNYNFNDSMITLYQSLYYKQGISNAATNDASDLYITPFV